MQLDFLHGAPMQARKVARLLSAAADTNATLVKAGPVNLLHIRGYNAKATVVYLKVYNKATAPAETDTPIMTIYLAATAVFDFKLPDEGLYFVLGLGYRLVTDNADNGTTAVGAGDILGLNIVYA